MTADAYPLQWPAGWPRTKRPTRSRFDTSFTSARASLFDELRLFGAKNVVLSTNLELRLDGLPYANRTVLNDDPGVALYFTRNGKEQCIPCDKWDRAGDNIHAIAKSLNALRGLERWGSKSIVDAAFTGFQALPPATPMSVMTMTIDEAAGFLVTHGAGPDTGIRPLQTVPLDWVINDALLRKALYRNAAKLLHPDGGGSDADFRKLQEANELLGG